MGMCRTSLSSELYLCEKSRSWLPLHRVSPMDSFAIRYRAGLTENDVPQIFRKDSFHT